MFSNTQINLLDMKIDIVIVKNSKYKTSKCCLYLNEIDQVRHQLICNGTKPMQFARLDFSA